MQPSTLVTGVSTRIATSGIAISAGDIVVFQPDVDPLEDRSICVGAVTVYVRASTYMGVVGDQGMIDGITLDKLGEYHV